MTVRELKDILNSYEHDDSDVLFSTVIEPSEEDSCIDLDLRYVQMDYDTLFLEFIIDKYDKDSLKFCCEDLMKHLDEEFPAKELELRIVR